MINELEQKFKDIQSFVKTSFEQLEPLKDSITIQDSWKRPEGGGGITNVMTEGDFFDNCAINFSSIFGKELPNAALAKSLNKEAKYGYRAMGISVISHPKNPHIPTSHMNVRLFSILDKNKEISDWWIGGGYDLTPFIPYEEDIIEWHNSAKKVLDQYGPNFYKDFSENCNNYFNIPHRNERRGVGGIFFDDLKDFPSPKEGLSFLKEISATFTKSYINIANKRKEISYDESQKEFQLIRRGRYVEFNLLYDRGTLFGLQSKGRIESILASLPASVRWSYKKSKEYKFSEKKLLEVINRDWNV
jgi:coproporphyrinogen III oxidase